MIAGQLDRFSLLDIGCNEGDLSMEILKLARKQIPEHVRCTMLGFPHANFELNSNISMLQLFSIF